MNNLSTAHFYQIYLLSQMYGYLVEVVFVSFSYEKLLPSSPYCCSWKEVTMPSSWLRSGNHASFIPKTMDLHKLFKILLPGRFVSISLIYSPNHLYQYGLKGIYFTSWIKFQFFLFLFFFLFCFFFFLEIILALAIESVFNWLLCPFDMAHHFMSNFLILYFLMLQGTLGSSWIFYFSKNPWFLLLKKPRPGFKFCSLLLVP